MYAYVRAGNVTDEQRESNHVGEDSREIAYWRKHPNLHGWMERLWVAKGRPGDDHHPNGGAFNGVELELNWEDIEQLEKDTKESNLPYTEGFFFGSPADEYYLQEDLQFIKNAKAELFMGLKVFYNSSW